MPGTYFGPTREYHSDYASITGNANLGQYPLGHTLILPDGREFKFALNDGTAEVAGNLYQSVAPVGNHSNVACDTPRAVGATAISATLGATAAAVDIYTEGYVATTDAAGEGYAYRIRRAMSSGAAHASAAASAVLTVNLQADDSGVQVALTTASEVTFSRNRWHQVLIHPSPPTGRLAGVSPGIAAANRFYWSQVRGLAAVLGDGTLLAGLPVMASISVDGAVENYKRRVVTGGTTALVTTATHAVLRVTDQDGTTTGVFVVVGTAQATGATDISAGIANNAPIVGICQNARADTEYSIIDLMIPESS